MRHGRWLLLLGIVLLAGWLAHRHSLQQAALARMPVLTGIGGDFRLPSTTGVMDTQALRGQPVLLQFSYTDCARDCTRPRLQALQALLGPQADDVQMVMLSFDPARDSVESLRRYLAGLPVQGAVGSESAMAAIAAQYGLVYFRGAGGADGRYAITHNEGLFLLDEHGRLRRRYGDDVEAVVIADDIRQLLAAARLF